MNGQLTGFDVLFDARLLDETFGQGVLLPMSDHPTDDITAEDIHDHVEIKEAPRDRAFELGDIPGPDLIGFCGQQFRFMVMGPLMSFSSLFDIAVLRGKDPNTWSGWNNDSALHPEGWRRPHRGPCPGIDLNAGYRSPSASPAG